MPHLKSKTSAHGLSADQYLKQPRDRQAKQHNALESATGEYRHKDDRKTCHLSRQVQNQLFIKAGMVVALWNNSGCLSTTFH